MIPAEPLCDNKKCLFFRKPAYKKLLYAFLNWQLAVRVSPTNPVLKLAFEHSIPKKRGAISPGEIAPHFLGKGDWIQDYCYKTGSARALGHKNSLAVFAQHFFLFGWRLLLVHRLLLVLA